MKKFLFIIFFFISSNLYSEQKLTLVASVNNFIITNLDISNEIALLKVLNNSSRIDDDQEKQVALENMINEILKDTEIKAKNIKLKNKELVDRRYNELLQKITENNKPISADMKGKIYQKIKLDYQWNQLIRQQYSWMISVNMNEINEKLDKIKKENTDPNKFIAIKEELIMTEKNKKMNTYSIIHMEKIKKKSLIKFF
jgi:parvulin-like peptidyl-prolyl isomerase